MEFFSYFSSKFANNIMIILSPAKYENEYKTIIEYVKTSKETKERVLAAQLISRFFKHFPAYEESAFDSIVDLCESVDVDVRKHATMAMIAICRDCKHLVSKAADILIQLYQTKEPSEVNLINQSLMTLLNLDIQKFLQSFFTNFEDGTEIVRERALKFLAGKIQSVSESLTKEVEEQLMTYSKKAMEDVTKDEFITFINILTKLKISKTATGQAMIVLIIKSQAELDKEFDVGDQDSLDRFLLCARQTISLLSQYNRASEYVNYVCVKILPHLNALKSSGNDLNILQVLAEMSPFVHNDDVPKLIDLNKCQQEVFNKLVEILPLPQIPAMETTPAAGTTATPDAAKDAPTKTENADAAKSAEDAAPASVSEVEAQKTDDGSAKAEVAATPAQTMESKGQDIQQGADFLFTHIEYLLFTFHQFGHFNPDFFTADVQSSIRLQLHNLSNGCTKYTEILSSQLRAVKSEDLKQEENKLRSVALRTTKNISVLIRDLFKKPPQFKASVVLSCKPLAASPETSNSSVSGSTGGRNINNNNNNTNKPPYAKGHNNNGNYNNNKPNFKNGRQAGQKHKYRQSYRESDRNKRPRQTR